MAQSAPLLSPRRQASNTVDHDIFYLSLISYITIKLTLQKLSFGTLLSCLQDERQFRVKKNKKNSTGSRIQKSACKLLVLEASLFSTPQMYASLRRVSTPSSPIHLAKANGHKLASYFQFLTAFEQLTTTLCSMKCLILSVSMTLHLSDFIPHLVFSISFAGLPSVL